MVKEKGTRNQKEPKKGNRGKEGKARKELYKKTMVVIKQGARVRLDEILLHEFSEEGLAQCSRTLLDDDAGSLEA